jgi:uncharacterized protein (DUF1697 family)
MTIYVALLRAVNVGGTGKLPMAELKAMCADAGFTSTKTYIASGNIVFESKASAAKVKAELEKRLRAYAGKSIDVALRTGAELKTVLKANPFAKTAPNFTYAVFLNEKPPRDAVAQATGIKDEELRLGKREIYIHYPARMGRSKVKIPAAKKRHGQKHEHDRRAGGDRVRALTAGRKFRPTRRS